MKQTCGRWGSTAAIMVGGTAVMLIVVN